MSQDRELKLPKIPKVPKINKRLVENMEKYRQLETEGEEEKILSENKEQDILEDVGETSESQELDNSDLFINNLKDDGVVEVVGIGDETDIDEGMESAVDEEIDVAEEESEEEYINDIENTELFEEDRKEKLTAEEEVKIESVVDKADEIKKLMEEEMERIVPTDSIIEDVEGNIIEPRNWKGGMYIDVIDVEKLIVVGTKEHQVRKGVTNTQRLQSDIKTLGLLEPLHVVPFGEAFLNEKGKMVYNKYVLLSGMLRLDAVMNLGYKMVPCLVDTTIPRELIPLYVAISNNVIPYTFTEKVEKSRSLKQAYPSLPYEFLENVVGFHSGEYLKAEYLITMQSEYPNYVKEVETGKLTIDQAFKKLEKEIEKSEKEENEEGKTDDEILREKGKNEEDLSEVSVERDSQSIKDRHVLDPVLRRTIESRDGGICQCCGLGKTELEDSEGNFVEKKYADLNAVFNVHHMVAVQYGGSDSEENLLLICSNCHKLAHDYESGRWIPGKDTYNDLLWVKKVVVLGNILLKSKQLSIEKLKEKSKNAYTQVEKKKRTLGQALNKEGVIVDAEKNLFEGSPYRLFVKEAEKIDGMVELGELSGNQFDFEEDSGEEEAVVVEE